MGLVALEITGENKDILAKLMQTEKRVDTLEAKLKGAGDAGKRAGREGADGFGQMALKAGEFALALAGVGSVEAVVGKIIAETKKGIEEMRKLQASAMGTQLSMEAAVGLFLANNQSLAKGDAIAPWKKFAEEQARSVPGVGAPKVLETLGQARSALAGTPDEDIKGAFAEAVKMAVLNPSTDLKAATEAMVRIKRDKGGTLTQAANFYSAFAEISGADISKTAAELPKLQALSSMGRGDITDSAALHGTLTSLVPDATGEATTNTVSALLTRVATRRIDMGKGRGKDYRGPREMDFRSDNSLDRLIEAAERINSGEFGDKAAAVASFVRSMGRESVSATLAINAMMANLPKVQHGIGALRSGWAKTASTTDEMLAARARAIPAEEAFKATREAKAEREAAELGNVGGASLATTEEGLTAWEAGMGMGSAWDFGRGLRRVIAERDTPTAEYLQAEKMRRTVRAVTGRGALSMTGPDVPAYAVEAQAAIGRATTPEEVLAAGARGGAVDTGTRLDLLEQNMLVAAGASPEKVSELQQTFEQGKKGEFAEGLRELLAELREINQARTSGATPEQIAALQHTFEQGMKDAFKQGLSELLMELRQNKTSPRQEID